METRSKRQLDIGTENDRQVLSDKQSCLGSEGSGRSKGSSRVLSARSELLKAQLREKQLLEELDLKKSILKARHDVETAQLEVKIAEEEEHLEDDYQPYSPTSKHDHISRYVADCERMAESNCNKEIKVEAARPVCTERLEMPKVEMSFFDGNPGDYWRFSKEFEYYIENRVADSGQRLLYLLHYCKGRAKLAIQDCVVLNPHVAYPRARQILVELFGETHVVARARIDRLIEGLKPVPEDGESLSHLSVELQNCHIALSEMNYTADLNSVATIEKVIRVLPLAVRRNWAQFADTKTQEGIEPGFADLCQFVAREARIARSRYGHLVHSGPALSEKFSSFGKPFAKPNQVRGSSFAVQAGSTSSGDMRCILCKSNHSTDRCSRFVALDISGRWKCARQNKACYLCLLTGHRAESCLSRIECRHDGCRKKHHPLLHTETENAKPVETGLCATSIHANSRVMLGVIPVKIRGHSGEVETYALLDSGSDTTLISADLIDRLNLKSESTSISLATVSGTSLINCKLSEFDVVSLDGNETIKVDRAFAVPRLPIRTPTVSLSSEAERWPHLSDLKFSETADKNVSLLIGCDVPEAHWILEQRIGERKQPFAVRTLLGWVLFGPLGRSDYLVRNANYTQRLEDDLTVQFNRLYQAEFADTEDLDHCLSQDDLKAIDIVAKGSKLVDGHYVIPLPWRDPTKITDNNYSVAVNRLLCLKRRFHRDSLLRNRYEKAMNLMFDKGYAIPVPQDQLEADYRPKWYLPHHPVFHPKKPEKLRIVLDCAASFNGFSLNDKLYQGPDRVSELVGVLLRFRENIIAVAADIEDMFMQVKVPVDDRGALRFLWWPNGCLKKPPQEFQMTVHPFGATSSPFCANYGLRKAVEDFGDLYSEHVKNAVQDNFYVDDCLASLRSVEEAKEFVVGITTLLKDAGFKLRKWMSNCEDILACIPESEKVRPSKSIDGELVKVERTLGLEWNSVTDCFLFQFKMIVKPITRRGLLSAVSSIFDPLGVISPLLLPVKSLLQSLCRRGIKWDDPLAPDDEAAWHNWVNAMEKTKVLQIPRCIRNGSEKDGTLQLHVLCDASETGYGAVVYVRIESSDGTVSCNLLLAKARVAPLKSMTIPRLELTAAVLAVKLYQIVSRNTREQYERVCFWTDSMTVLYYIRDTSSRFGTFVANRLTHIHQFSVSNQWNYVPSDENTADLASRGTLNLKHMELWLHGPAFLLKEEQLWPRCDSLCEPRDIELKRQVATVVHTVVQSNPLNELWMKYSRWMSLVKAVAWILRLRTYFLVKFCKRPPHLLERGLLKLPEIRQATTEIVRLVQREVYHNAFKEIEKNSNADCGKQKLHAHPLKGLCPIIKDGLLCVGGRLTYADIPSSTKHPAILPQGHVVTEMLIRHFHVLEGHCGVSHVLSMLRRTFWIVHGITTVRRVIGKCVECRRRSAVSCQQLMAPLPIARVEAGWYPFRHVGVDYFGPFLVKRGRGTEKRYGCVFTCLQMRAVHLEVAHSLSTDAFIMVLMRFIARRGAPSEIYSDNGTNFVGASREFRQEISGLHQQRVNNFLLSKNVQWHFQPPNASHRGGVWERVIRSVRRILNALCHEQRLTDESLLTFMAEVERILNDRPIVPLTSDSRDDVALSPNHLLILRANPDLTAGEELGIRFTSAWKQSLYLASIFWRRWMKEYLPLLQTRNKWITKSRNLQNGDVVIVAPDSTTRERWPLGVIVDNESSKDGLVRTVLIRTKAGVIRRDVRKVCLLEGSL